MNNETLNTNEKYINKKGAKLNIKPKVKIVEETKSNIRSTIWIIVLFIILFATLILLPYMSNYR